MRRYFDVLFLLLWSAAALAPSTRASGFLFAPGSWPYGHQNGLDGLDDNPAAGFDEAGAGVSLGTMSFRPGGSAVYANRGRYEWGASPWPRYYPGEPDTLRVALKNQVYYPLSARGRVPAGDWAFSVGVRIEGGRLTKFSHHYYFDNPSTLNYDRLLVSMREALQFQRFRIAASRRIGASWRLGLAGLAYTGSFEGFYLKEYDYLGIWPDYRDYRLKVTEKLDGYGFGAQAGCQWGEKEDETRIGFWISSGSVFYLEGRGSWERDSEFSAYSQRIQIALPPRAELIARFPLPWVGWGLHVGTHATWWRTDPYRRATKPLDIPEPSWRPTVDGMIGVSFQPPSGWELGAGYRFLRAAGNDRNWPNSHTDQDQHHLDAQAGYTFQGLTLRAFGGMSFAAGRAATDPSQMEIGSTLAYSLR